MAQAYVKPGCPNYYNGYFTGMLGQYGKNPKTRKFLYFGVCVWARFGLFTLVYMFHTRPRMINMVLLLSAITLITQFATNDPNSPQWWSGMFVMGMALLVFLACLLVILRRLKSIWIPRLLYASLIGGLLQTLRTDFC